jgi:hypothetical protein
MNKAFRMGLKPQGQLHFLPFTKVNGNKVNNNNKIYQQICCNFIAVKLPSALADG